MKRFAGISLVFLCVLSAIISPGFANNTPFSTVQEYYVGEVMYFGNDYSNNTEVCHDFNNDGICDLFFLKPYDEGNPVLRATILFGSANGGFPTMWDIEVVGKTYTELEYNLLIPLVLDANGDGLDDFLTVNAEYSMGTYSYDVHINNTSPIWETVTQDYAYWAPYNELTLQKALAACDCNGDGRDDFMGASIGCNDYYCQPIMVMPVFLAPGYTVPTYLMDTSGFVVWTDAGVGDFNGDGVPDFFERSYYAGVRIHAGDGGCNYHLFDGVGTILSGYAMVGNFNGDQYDDLIHTHEMMCTPDGYYAKVMFGGSEELSAGPTVTFPYNDRYLPVVVADVNTDGLDDVGVIDRWYSDFLLPIYFNYSEGETFGADPDTLYLQKYPEYFHYRSDVFSWDFNSDGRDDLLYFVAPDTIGVLLQQGPIATFLQSFAVRLEGLRAARLEWEVSGSADCESFSVSRSTEDESFTQIAAVAADPLKDTYNYTDEDISDLSGSDVTYRLEALYTDGSSTVLAEQDVTVPRAELALHQNYPNPFNPGTVLSFTLPKRAAVTLDIYDVTGRLVCRLIESEELEAGPREVFWDGVNDAGRSVSSGVYYCRLTAGKTTVTRKLVLMR
jgi:hypothetical protein